MSSEAFVEETGQRILRLSAPACGRCYWSINGKCSGPQTVDSQLLQQGNLLTCFDSEETRKLIANLQLRLDAPENVSPTRLERLPSAIPVLCRGMPKELRLGSESLFGIALDDLLLESGALRYRSGWALRKDFRLPRNGRICLVASVQEERLERFWERAEKEGLWSRLGTFGFEFATGTSFSVYECQSRNGQLVSAERNRASVDFLARTGIPPVPIFCEILQEDLESAAEWIANRPWVQVVGGLAQSWRSDLAFERFVRRMLYLQQLVDRPIHFLIIGCSAAERIKRLHRDFRSVTVATTNMTLKGRNGVHWDREKRRFFQSDKEESIASVIQSNHLEWMQFCEEAQRLAA